MKTRLIESIARELYYKAQTAWYSPRFPENQMRVSQIIEQAEKAGCPIVDKIKASLGVDRKRICSVSLDGARTIAQYIVNYKEKTYTVTFRFPNSGRIKTITHRDEKEVERLREEGLLISAIEEK